MQRNAMGELFRPQRQAALAWQAWRGAPWQRRVRVHRIRHPSGLAKEGAATAKAGWVEHEHEDGCTPLIHSVGTPMPAQRGRQRLDQQAQRKAFMACLYSARAEAEFQADY